MAMRELDARTGAAHFAAATSNRKVGAFLDTHGGAAYHPVCLRASGTLIFTTNPCRRRMARPLEIEMRSQSAATTAPPVVSDLRAAGLLAMLACGSLGFWCL